MYAFPIVSIVPEIGWYVNFLVVHINLWCLYRGDIHHLSPLARWLAVSYFRLCSRRKHLDQCVAAYVCVSLSYCLLEGPEDSKCAETRATYQYTYGPYGCFLKWWYPPIIHFYRVFHYKPYILGYPYCWKHSYPHIKPYQTISSNDVMYSKTCVFYVALQISIPHNLYIYIYIYVKLVAVLLQLWQPLARAGCESHWVGGVGGFVPFDPFYAMPAVTIAFKYEEQALQLYQLSLTGLLSWGSFVWFWCWSLVDFFQVRTCQSWHLLAAAIFDHRSGHINLIWTWMPRSWILKVP